MASVYKSISKKKLERPVAEDDEDIDMEDLLDEDLSDDTDSDEEDDEEEEDEEEAGGVRVNGAKSDGTMPKSRVLMLTSRGVTHRQRHLLSDMTALLPHAHKENKLDTKKSGGYNNLLNSLAELHSCNVVFFLEARKRGQDLYLWLARPPNGPTIKFSITNLHTMGEMGTGFAGNCLKGGRGIVVFDKSFDANGPEVGSANGTEYRGLIREMLRKVFCVPKRGVRGMKPFVDRIIGIFGVDGKIWIRVYEIRESDSNSKSNKPEEVDGKEKKDDEKKKPKSSSKSKDGLPDVSLVEVGPRLVLTPIVILEGSFGGPVIYENKEYVSPNQVRRDVRLEKASRYAQRRDTQTDHLAKKSTLGLGREGKKRDALDTREVFG